MMWSQVANLVGSSLQPMHEKSGFMDTELTLATFDAAAEMGVEAVTGSGVGLDLFNGERVLAAALFHETPKGGDHRLSVAITDRRTVLSGWSSIREAGSSPAPS